MKRSRIHLTGASGSGVTTLGRALAGALAIPHHDTDDYFWFPTVPPYKEQRPVADRLRLMGEMFLPRADWILSGSLGDWASELVPYFDLVVFVSAPTELRLVRLHEREARHFGHSAVKEGGWRHGEAQTFLDWAAGYDDGSRKGRNRQRHEAWLAALPCPVIRVDGSRTIEELSKGVMHYWFNLE